MAAGSASNNTIILSSNPKGVFDSGVIDDTSKPGTCMEMVTATTFQNGRPHWRASSDTVGTKRGICVLVEDWLQGKLVSDAFVSGTFIPNLYWPALGEELNLLVANVSGTGSAERVLQGDRLGVSAAGKLILDSSYATRPFQAMEEQRGFITADFLLWVKFLGTYA